MRQYDVIIVGAGIAGSVMALELAKKQKHVLIIEAGPDLSFAQQDFQNHFLSSTIKLPESPYPPYSSGPKDPKSSPRSLYAQRYTSMMQFNWPAFNKWGTPEWKPAIDIFNAHSHVQAQADPPSELPLLSTYERMVGGTTWHWLGTCLRLLENDLRTKTKYGFGQDWPMTYKELSDDYILAERFIGVAGDRDTQAYPGTHFPPDYQYPMKPVPSSYSDTELGRLTAGLEIDFDGETLPVSVTNTPQGRKSVTDKGGRPACEGNNSCIPLCPVRAKFDASMPLTEARSMLDKHYQPLVELLEKTVAYKLIVDPVTKRITEVQTKTYDTEKKGHVSDGSYSAPVIVVAAHAIETARLLLFSKQEAAPSGVANSSGLVGQNLMDHLVYLSWGLSPVPLYPFRGPRSSSGIESLRDGQFRKNHAAFRVDIGNEGWGWADGDPQTLVWDLLTGSNNSGLNPHKAANRFGSDLVERLNSKLTRMMRFCFLVEQEPMASNCVTLSGDTDGLGMNRPIVNYQAGPLALKGIAKAIDVTKRIFAYAGIHNHTQAHDDEDGYACVRVPDGAGSKVVNVYGAGHIMGTYRMGTDRTNGVVNADQQSFDHPNLFLLGSGTFPTVGTANPTLTIVALAFRASRAVLKQLAARG